MLPKRWQKTAVRMGFLHGSSHRVKSAVNQWKVDRVIIPGGMILILQPLDVAVNWPFKHNTRNLWNEWMMNGQKEYNKAGKIKAPTRQQVVQWTVESWGFITKDSIINRFRKCCITNKLDGSEDDALFEDFVSSSRSAASDSSDSSDEEGVPGVPKESLMLVHLYLTNHIVIAYSDNDTISARCIVTALPITVAQVFLSIHPATGFPSPK